MNQEFRSSYESLGLDSQADWPTIQATYRRLVNRWHPDRHRDSQEQQVVAQREFIKVTRAFNDLRDFYREYQRLPLQPQHAHREQQQRTASPNQADAAPVSGARRPSPGVHTKPPPAGPRAAKAPELSDDEIISSSILGGSQRQDVDDQHSSRTRAQARRSPGIWLVPVAILAVLGTLAFMLVLDVRKANDLKLEARGAALESQAEPQQRQLADELAPGSTATRIFLQQDQ